MIAAGVVLGCWWVGARLGWKRPWVAGAIGGLVVLSPPGGFAAVAIVVARRRWLTARQVSDSHSQADDDVVLLADLMVLGVTAGLTLRGAIETARPHLAPTLRGEVGRLLERMDRAGTAAALAGSKGRLADLGRVAAGAAVSGAPIAAAVTAYSRTRRHADHAKALERARRLPVRLLLPLALLILPGFVLLAVGPAVLEGLARLGPIP